MKQFLYSACGDDAEGSPWKKRLSMGEICCKGEHACEVVSGKVCQLKVQKLIMNDKLILAHRSIQLTFCNIQCNKLK